MATNGAPLLSGRAYIGAVQLALGTLRTKLRAARGFHDADVTCDCCGRVESLGHILQVCPRSHRARNARHDRVVDLAYTRFTELGYEVVLEPRILTPMGYRRPDLVAWKAGCSAIVVDATVLADNADLDREHDHKSSYYDVPAVRDYVGQLAGLDASRVQFRAVVFNWRGAMSLKSASDLRRCGFSDNSLELMGLRVLEGGMAIYMAFQRGTYREGT